MSLNEIELANNHACIAQYIVVAVLLRDLFSVDMKIWKKKKEKVVR